MRSKLKINLIDPKAMQIVDILQKKGHLAYLVGGCVRDILIDHEPKDFDIATSAKPEEVKRLISHSYLIGRRFKLVLVKRGIHQYEISTFRRSKGIDDDAESADAIEGDNYYGNQEEDSQRRDFTINALFFDPIKNELIDYCDGLADLAKRVIKFIGEPDVRILEDPIRILRGLRLSHKLNFSLDPEFRKAIIKNAESLNSAILPRKREEYLKILKLNFANLVFIEMYDLEILKYILPSLNELFHQSEAIETFSYYLQLSRSFISNYSEPIDIFSSVIFAFIKAHPELSSLEFKDLEEHPKLAKFMKEELGVFKLETTYFLKTLSFMNALTNRELFQRKGERRKSAFLSHPHLQLANELSRMENSIKYSEYFFWKTQIENRK